MLQKSLLSQNEEQRRVTALEKQIQLSAKDFEDEKLDRQSMQHQLHKVLKELRKARDQIARLESAKQTNARFSEPNSYNNFERLSIDDPPGPTSPSKVPDLLDESFLECPRCRTPYPTSRHRELLAHIDYCFA
ncbi:Centrosomal protein [Liparis tanakae]|uniref:Centrosomal protein n=1 Tax=Liparis tanakae TaxID=230148 RepID=A0A4Z2GAN4_9TELE|nr:Centrosomal protein [Liparis tanakae]